jgi:hypothetical protein
MEIGSDSYQLPVVIEPLSSPTTNYEGIPPICRLCDVGFVLAISPSYINRRLIASRLQLSLQCLLPRFAQQ